MQHVRQGRDKLLFVLLLAVLTVGELLTADVGSTVMSTLAPGQAMAVDEKFLEVSALLQHAYIFRTGTCMHGFGQPGNLPDSVLGAMLWHCDVQQPNVTCCPVLRCARPWSSLSSPSSGAHSQRSWMWWQLVWLCGGSASPSCQAS